jgi:hypothetical protein
MQVPENKEKPIHETHGTWRTRNPESSVDCFQQKDLTRPAYIAFVLEYDETSSKVTSAMVHKSGI